MITGAYEPDIYDCNGVQKEFPITFPFHEADDIGVTLKHTTTGDETDLTNPDDFTIDGSNVVTGEAYSSNYELWILRNTDKTQTVDFEDNTSFPARDSENAHDKLTMLVQELARKLARAVLFVKTTTSLNFTFPEPENETCLWWRDGKLVNTRAFGGAVYAIQAFMKTFLESVNVATARTNLDVYGKSDSRPADHVSIADAGGRFTGEQVEAALQELAGDGRTTETVKQNADDIGQLIPIGIIWPFGGTNAPSGYLLCDGSAISRTTYAGLFAVLGTAFGEGNGSTTFNIPDLRGQFLRGRDGGAGIDPDSESRPALKTGGNTGDAVGSKQLTATKKPNMDFTTGIQSASHKHSATLYYNGASQGAYHRFSEQNTYSGPSTDSGETSNQNTSHTHTVTGGGDNESRPPNVYVNFIIKF